MRRKFYHFLFLVISTVCIGQNTNSQQSLPNSEDVLYRKLRSIQDGKEPVSPKELLRLKRASENLHYQKGILMSVDLLISEYSKADRNKEIVELVSQIEPLIKDIDKDPSGEISSIYRKKALALMYLGLDSASKENTFNARRLARTISDPDLKHWRLSQISKDLHSYFNSRENESAKKADQDSSLYYLKRSLDENNLISDKSTTVEDKKKYNGIVETYTRLGIFYLEHSDKPGNLKLAEKSLLQAEQIQNSRKVLNGRFLATLLNQLSWLYLEKKDFPRSIDYARSALDVEKSNRRPSARVESFEFLADSYLELGDKKLAKYYMDRYTVLKDSINIANRQNTEVAASTLIKEVKEDGLQKSRNQLVLGLLVLLVVLSVALILWIRQKKLMRSRYEVMISSLKEGSLKIPAVEKRRPEVQTTVRNKISDVTEQNILSKINDFENGELFLSGNLSLTSLATTFETNPKYLTEVIKKYRSQSFNNYINALRINYIINKLYNEPEYRSYKISYLAESAGFVTYQVFILSFKKMYGVTPSYFIQNLNTATDQESGQ